MNKEIIKRIESWKNGNPSPPYKAQLHLSHLCNLKCIFCEVHNFKRLDELSTEEFISLIKQGNKLGIEEWHICGGGEPLFFKEKAKKVFIEIKKGGKIGELVTNGTLFDEELIKTMVKLKWDNITISIDSSDEKTYNFIRGKESFKKVIKNIDLLNYYKQRLNSKLPRLTVNLVMCSKNHTHLKNMVNFCHDKKIDFLQLLEINIWAEEMKKYDLDQNQKKDLVLELKKAYELANKLKVQSNIKDIIEHNLVFKANNMIEVLTNKKQKFQKPCVENSSCFYPWYVISIFPDGRVLPCFNLKDTCENLKEKSLKDIWYGDYFNSMRRQVVKNELYGDCNRCFPQDFVETKEIRDALVIIK